MGLKDSTEAKLTGGPEEVARRRQLLDKLLQAAEAGGPQGVAAEINRQAEALEGRIVELLRALRGRL